MLLEADCVPCILRMSVAALRQLPLDENTIREGIEDAHKKGANVIVIDSAFGRIAAGSMDNMVRHGLTKKFKK